jgi:hypothetical protein
VQSELHLVIKGETMSTLGEFLAHVQQVETTPCPPAEEWADLINRSSIPGRIAEVSEDTAQTEKSLILRKVPAFPFVEQRAALLLEMCPSGHLVYHAVQQQRRR